VGERKHPLGFGLLRVGVAFAPSTPPVAQHLEVAQEHSHLFLTDAKKPAHSDQGGDRVVISVHDNVLDRAQALAARVVDALADQVAGPHAD